MRLCGNVCLKGDRKKWLEAAKMSNDQGNELSRTVELSSNDIEKLEEAKLMAKFPNTGRPINGHSAFLQKRLAKGQKYFDSGDYQMAKQKYTAKPKPAGVLPTGDAIPTPETVPQRKTSIIQQKFNTSSTS